MSEITKDFIKFVAEVFALLIIFSVVFSPEGIATSTFNYFVFAEPILLQNYIASAMTIGSQAKGDFYSNIKLTSGQPHTVRIFYQDNIPYVSVIPSQETFSRTTYSDTGPTPIITSCELAEQEIKLPNKADQTLRVEKTFEDGKCKLTLTVGSGLTPPESKGNLACDDGTMVVPGGQCSVGNPPKYCDNGNLIDKCSQCGCPGAHVCTDSGECFYGGILNVYAFSSGTSVKINVSNGLGDVNWDGVVNNSDTWYYNSGNPNSCYGTIPGNLKWNIDCDMNLDNIINMTDINIVTNNYDRTTQIKTTPFTSTLAPGTYTLRAKYNSHIKNNESVVIIGGQTTRVDFNFP